MPNLWAISSSTILLWHFSVVPLNHLFQLKLKRRLLPLQELIFRGLMLQAVQKLAGHWLALAATSLFFGVAHLGNSGATLWSALAIAIEAGVLLGAAFLWRRNLWFVMGLHFAWNSLEGILGIPVSGHASVGLFRVEMKGAALLTGGNFGLEGSVVPVAISLLIAIPMLIAATRNRAVL